MPQVLQDAYAGFTSDKVIADYLYFADTGGCMWCVCMVYCGAGVLHE